MRSAPNQPAPLPCDFREEDGLACESGYRCTVCDGVGVTNRRWLPVEDCLAAAAERDEAA